MKQIYVKNFTRFINESMLTEGATKSEVQLFLTDFGFFLYMNLAKVQSKANSEPTADHELEKILKVANGPLINGKNFQEILNDNNLFKNPKYLSALFQQIKMLIEYIEPRLERFVKDGDIKTAWLEKLKKFREDYIKIVS